MEITIAFLAAMFLVAVFVAYYYFSESVSQEKRCEEWCKFAIERRREIFGLKSELAKVRDELDRVIAERGELLDKLGKRSAALFGITNYMDQVAGVINGAFGLDPCKSPDDCKHCPGECKAEPKTEEIDIRGLTFTLPDGTQTTY